MKDVRDMTDKDWLEWEQRRKLRDRAGQVIDDPQQMGFGFGETLNVPAPRKRRYAEQPLLF